ncbi:MAG: class I SAM-dependent methyltransferase [Thermoplasmata archaeon]|nr:MAG: class I SAM-dependent methyltransferase [Thermoplasmata archaeon]
MTKKSNDLSRESPKLSRKKNKYDKTRMDPKRETYDDKYFDLGIYSSYKQGYENYIEDLRYPDIVDDIIKNVKPKRVLDIGCAFGRVVEMFCSQGVEAYGVDISDYAISKASDDIKKRLFQVNVENEKIPFPDGHFDFISCLVVIEHLHDDTHLLNEISRLISKKGTVYITTPPKSYEPSYTDKTHINLHDPEYWIKRFGDFGFNIEPLRIHQMFGYTYMKSIKGTYWKVKNEKPTSNFGSKLPRSIWIYTVTIIKFIRNSRLFKRNRYIWAYILTKAS